MRRSTKPQPAGWTPEAKRVADFLASSVTGHTTLLTKDLRSLLLESGGQLLARGRLYNIKTRSLGAGVHRVELTLANP